MAQKPPPGLASRVIASIITVAGWLIFALLFLTFYSNGFDLVEKIVIVLVSLIIVGAILGSMWAYWGIKVSRRYTKYEK